MHLSTTRRPKTLAEAVLRATGFHPPVHKSAERLFEQYNVKFCEGYNRCTTALAGIAHDFMGVDPHFPTPPALGMEVATQPYPRAKVLVEQTVQRVLCAMHQELVRLNVGTVEFGPNDESCRFTFHDTWRRRGIFRETVSRTPHTHLLVRPRVRRIDDKDVQLPEVARAIVGRLPEELRAQARIIVGTEVGKEVGPAEVRTELTPFGRKVKGVGQQAARAGAALAPFAIGALAATLVGTAVVGGVMLTSAMLATAFVADPAIVLGDDVCLHGWDID